MVCTPPVVLVVDDDELVRETVAMVLAAAGNQVVTATGGAEGLELARARRPDVIVLDMMMPDVDGLEVLDRLPLECSAPLPAVVAYSGFDKFEALALSRGAVAFFRKPFNPARLIETIEAILSRAATTPPVVYDPTSAARAERLREEFVRLFPRDDPGLRRQLRQLVCWSAGYFGVEKSLIGLLCGDSLRVLAQSGAREFSEESPLPSNQSFCPEVTRAMSPLVIRDTRGTDLFRDHPASTSRMPYYAGAPLLTRRGLSLGALCVRASSPFVFHAEDLAVLSHFARLAGAAIGSLVDKETAPPLFVSDHFFCMDTLLVLADAELRRADRDGSAAILAIERGESRTPSIEARARLAAVGHGVIAGVGGDLIAILLGSPDIEQGEHLVRALAASVASPLAPTTLGIACFTRNYPAVGPESLLEAAMAAYRDALSGVGSGTRFLGGGRPS